jgi:hypothetical protein
MAELANWIIGEIAQIGGITMSLESMTEDIKRGLRQVMQTREQRWRTPDDQQRAVQTLQQHLTAAERALRVPPAPALQRAHDQLVIEYEMAKGTLRQFGHTTDDAS